jgi:hypothetical protein
MSSGFEYGRAVDRMKQLTELSYVAAVERLRGQVGIAALFELLEKIKQIWHHVPFEMMTDGLIVRYRMEGDEALESSGGQVVYDPSELSGYTLSGITLELLSAGRIRMWPGVDKDFAPLEFPGLVYVYVHVGQERLFLDGETWMVPDNAWPCSLGVPTFSCLESVLSRYVQLTRRPEYCAHIAQSWRDQKRLAFLPKPERHLRRSLYMALRYSLEGAVVRQEQRQDETKPVDVELTWWSPGRSAIIEVKWMGHSGHRDETEWSTSYDHRRARDGLTQLCDYLDRRDGATPNVPVVGYIFVFDAMRDNLDATSESISEADGLRYQFEDVEYQANLLARPDVGRPFRCFLEPVVD